MPEESKGKQPERLGKYEIIEELGRGGMARVFKARNTETEEIVALKLLMPELTVQPAFVKRFRREIETLKTLHHPGIVAILDVGEEGHHYYYVMEYMDGDTLDKRMSREKKLSPAESLKYARAISNALHFAHSAGVVHRDIKPANIMTDSSGNIKLADFGIAKEQDATRLTVTGGIVGTADYMSPEQAEGRRVTARSDVYSLGVCLYEMLTGRVPFTGKTYMDVIRAHRYSIPESPKALNPALPGRVARLVESMMEKDPQKRPGSGAEVIRQIDGIEQVGSALTDDEVEKAGAMVRSVLMPAADWKTVVLRVTVGVVLATALIFAAWGSKYRYFTTAGEKYALAEKALLAGEYEEAKRYFEDVVYFHPESDETEKAEEMVALTLYKVRQMKAEERVRPTKPDAVSLYEDAVELIESGEREEGVRWLERIAEDFAETEGGELAVAKLSELGAEGASGEGETPPEATEPEESPTGGQAQ